MTTTAISKQRQNPEPSPQKSAAPMSGWHEVSSKAYPWSSHAKGHIKETRSRRSILPQRRRDAKTQRMEEEPVPRDFGELSRAAPRPCPSRARDIERYWRSNQVRSEAIFSSTPGEEDERQGAKNAKGSNAKGDPAGRPAGARNVRPPDIPMAAAATDRYLWGYEPRPAGAGGMPFCAAGSVNH